LPTLREDAPTKHLPKRTTMRQDRLELKTGISFGKGKTNNSEIIQQNAGSQGGRRGLCGFQGRPFSVKGHHSAKMPPCTAVFAGIWEGAKMERVVQKRRFPNLCRTMRKRLLQNLTMWAGRYAYVMGNTNPCNSALPS
jgi:hypothetical protein